MEKLTKVLQGLKGSIRDNDAVGGVVRSRSGHCLQERRGKDRVEDQRLGVFAYQPHLVRFTPHIQQVGKHVPLVILSIPQCDQRATTLNRVGTLIGIMK